MRSTRLITLGLTLSTAGFLLFGSRSAQAANATWNGTTDSIWATTTNWSATPVPGTGNTATFNSAANAHTTLSLGTGVTIGTVLFDTANAAAYTIGSGAVGSQTLTLDNGGAVTMNAAVAANELFNSAIVLGTSTVASSYTLTNESTTNSLNFAGNISRNGTTNTKTLTVGGAGHTTIGGVIGGTALALAKNDSGRLTLSGTNTFTGAIKVNRGILNIQNASALGTAAGGISIGDTANHVGATLQLEGGITVGNEPISISGGYAPGATGALESVSGTNNYGGLLTCVPTVVGSGFIVTLTADAGSTLNLTNTGAITGNLVTLSLDGGGTGTISSVIGTSVAGLVKYGTGSWTLLAANTYTGKITIYEGTLNLFGSGKLGTTAAELVMGGGTLDLGGTSQSIGALTGPGNGIATGTILNNGGGASTLTVGNGNADGSFDGTIIDHTSGTGTVALTKTGAGIFSLGLANSYSGPTLINGGVFVIGHGDSLGATTNGTTVASGATLILGGNCIVGAEALTIGGAGASGQTGALVNNGDDTYGGLLNLTANTTISSNFGTLILSNPGTILGPTRALTLTGAGDGSVASIIGTTTGGVTKSGTGKWTLSGANTFSGAVTVSAGILNLQNATAAGTTAGGISVTSGATLQLQGNITVGAEALTIRGSGAAGTTGALQNVSGTNNYGGVVTLGTVSTISSDAGTLNLTNAGTLGGAGIDLTLTGAGEGSIASLIGTGTGKVTKTGTGKWTLFGANTFTGLLTVANGTLAVPTVNDSNVAGPLGKNTTVVTLGGAGTTGTLAYTGGTASSTKTFTLATGGIGGFQVDQAATNLSLNGAGAGTLTLAAANGYGGATQIAAGTLVVSVAGAISSSSGITTDSGGTLALAGAGALDRIGNAVPLTLNGGTLSTAGLSNATERFGNFSVTAHSAIDFGAGSGNSLIFAGVGTHTLGTKLSITNWSGTPYQLGTASNDRLLFDGSATAFLYTQSDVSFNGITGYISYQYDGSHFEIIGIPEPSTAGLLGAVALCSLIGLRPRRLA
jgi:autotransporter-associated beta strand protein